MMGHAIAGRAGSERGHCLKRVDLADAAGPVAEDDSRFLAEGVAVRTSLLRLEGTFDPAYLRVEGEVDLSTSEVFATTLATVVERGAGDVWVDVQGLDFIDVAGLRAMAAAACRLGLSGRRLVLRSVAPRLVCLMDLVGWSDIPGLTMIPQHQVDRMDAFTPSRTGA